tara:strand:- start:169 stop:363 length:195 start_codon:yes stop_codon:yes gene_type:complete
MISKNLTNKLQHEIKNKIDKLSPIEIGLIKFYFKHYNSLQNDNFDILFNELVKKTTSHKININL